MKESDIDLCYISATDALAKFQSRDLSYVELTNLLIKRCKEVNPLLNAITETYFDEARLQAKVAEKIYEDEIISSKRPRRNTYSNQ